MPLFKTPPPSTSRVLLNQIQDEGGGEGLAPGPRRSTRTRRQRVPFSPSSTPSKTQSQAPARVAVRRSPRIANAAASQPPGLLPRDDDSDVEEDEEDEVFVDAANNVEPPSPHPPHHPPPDGMADLDVDAEAEFWGDHDQLNDDPTGADAGIGGSQGTQADPGPQLPEAASLPTLQEAHSTYIPTHKWPPKACRTEFTRALTSLWQSLAANPADERLWVMEAIFCRVILPAGQGPARLRRWNNGECAELWAEAVAGERKKSKDKKKKGGKDKPQKSQEEKNAARSVILTQEGQYTRALQALVSNGLAECTLTSLKEMQSKHPLPARPQPPHPTTDVPACTFNGAAVASAALSFHKESAAGPSGMRPEHFKAVLKSTSSVLAEKALVALIRLVNVMAAGKVPKAVAPFLCGARLHAGKKKDNSLRPIAVGNLLRRLVSKCFSSALADRAAALLSPHQLGVGVRGGCEAIAHAVKEAVETDPSRWVLQADLVNAYNQADRGAMLEEVSRHFPECLSWVITCYGAPSHLKFGEYSIDSSTGLHQGGPLAGLLFCLTLKPVVDAIQEEVPTLALNACYLDDMHQVGTVEELTAVVDIVLREGLPRGLILSTAATVEPPIKPKSSVWSPMARLGDQQDQDPLQRGLVRIRCGEGITVLGAPVGYRAYVREKIEEKVEKIRNTTEQLPLLRDPHCEFVLLRSCLALPKVMFLLRALDTSEHTDLLENFDSITRGALSKILGAADDQWLQAKLPVAMGGLGLRAAEDHAPVAFASSLLASQRMVHYLLGKAGDILPSLPQQVLDRITLKQGEQASTESLTGVTQKAASLKLIL